MKIWVDAKNPAPDSTYKVCTTADAAIKLIQDSDKAIQRFMKRGHERFLARDYPGRTKCYQQANMCEIELFDIALDITTKDADGYNRLMDYVYELGRDYKFVYHENPKLVTVETLNDQEAIAILRKAKVEDIQEFSAAVAYAGNRLIDLQWHDYVVNDPKLPRFGAKVILGIKYTDGSKGSVDGIALYNDKTNERYLDIVPEHKNMYTDGAVIEKWMKYPEYK